MAWWGYGLVFVFAGLYALFVRSRLVHKRRLDASAIAARKDETLDSFIRRLDAKPYGRNAIEAAYADLTAAVGFSVVPHDDLEKDLGLWPEDFEDIVNARCEEQGVEDVFQTAYASLFPLWTVEDYVRFVDELMRGEREAREGSRAL
jgi:hypothetical protein